MEDVRPQKKEGSAVSDRMRYIPKPIAVRSENWVTNIRASDGSLFNGDGLTRYFNIPTTILDARWYLFLDRGPQSIINRFQLYDASGHLLISRTNIIRVDPAVDRGIIDASRGTD